MCRRGGRGLTRPGWIGHTRGRVGDTIAKTKELMFEATRVAERYEVVAMVMNVVGYRRTTFKIPDMHGNSGSS